LRRVQGADVSRISLRQEKRAAFVVEDQRYAVSCKSVTAPNREVAMGPMRRKLVWVERPTFHGWACTECAWVFNPSEPIAGKSIDEMKTNFGQQRDKAFASHACAEHPMDPRNRP
jgi:hypothetical protein